jgi:iron complex transport system permease protein
MKDRSAASSWLPWTAAAVLFALAFGLAAGSSGWGWADGAIVWSVRAPRVAVGFACGAGLGLAGALLQCVTRNPLADASVLGVAAGAALGAMGVLALAPGDVSPWWSMAGAALGAIAATAALLGLSWRALGRVQVSAAAPGHAHEATVTLLLLGVMIGSACAAAMSLLLALAPEARMRSMVFWMLGDLNGATEWPPVLAAVLLALLLVLPRARAFDVMARGDAWAQSLGVAVVRERRIALLAAAMATGAAVATAGAIGFVGLVVPHALRLLGIRASRGLLLASALAGGAFVVIVDALARTVVAPVQLPAGVLASAIGVPVFVAMLLRRPGERA